MRSAVLVFCGTLLGIAYAFTGDHDVGKAASVLLGLGLAGMIIGAVVG